METTAFFVQPRPKKGLVPPPPSKKRKTVHKVEEVTFDRDARAEYLSGFRKRKQARIKHAQEVAEKKAREEKIEMRKQIREERKKELEEHVQHVHRLLREADAAGAGNHPQDDSDEEWGGISDEEEDAEEEPIDHEEEYIDEERHTVVTVEAVSVDKEGLYKPIEAESEDEEQDGEPTQPDESKGDSSKKAKDWPKKKKKKFRYETKVERRLAGKKQKVSRAR